MDPAHLDAYRIDLVVALALAAIPGSLVPQRRVSPVRVTDFINEHPTLGPVYDKLGLFNVYSLAVVRDLPAAVRVPGRLHHPEDRCTLALRARPPKTPRNLVRLPAYAAADLTESDHDVLDRAASALRSRHYRVAVHGDSVQRSCGYLREAGNLVFHISLVFVLVGVAIGTLFGFRGTSVVIVGQGFSNNLTQYDDFSAGGRFTEADLVPFSVI